MSKYIVDTDDFEPMFKVDSIGVFGIGKSVTDNTEYHSWSRIKSLVDFEELNSDYINEHYGVLQDEAYQRGVEDGRNETWEAVKKISLMSPDEIEKVFPGAAKYNRYNLGYSGVEAIEKLKAYEEKQKAEDDIKVGDVVDWDGDLFIVTYIAFDGLCGVAEDGATYDAVLPKNVKKTGRHFDIADMLKGINWT